MFRIIIVPKSLYGSLKQRNLQVAKRFFSAVSSSNSTQREKFQYLGTVYSRVPTRLFCTADKAAKPESEPEPETKVSSEGEKADETEKQSEEQPKGQIIRKIVQDDDDYYDDYEGGSGTSGYKKYMSYFILTTITGIVLYASYSIGIELFGRSAPGHLYDETFDIVRVNDEIMRMTGDPMRAYGMETGRNTEGRRNFIQSRKYVAEDGSKRTRIRYYVAGPRGKAAIYVEVSDRMENHEFVYLIAQDLKTGRVFTVSDNRAELAKNAPEPSNVDALTKLLRGG